MPSEGGTPHERASLGPEDTRHLSVWRLLQTSRLRRGDWSALLVLALAAWIGGLAFLAPYRPTEVSRVFTRLVSAETWYMGVLAVALTMALVGLGRRNRALGYAAVTVLAYLAGFAGFGALVDLTGSTSDVPFEDAGDLLEFVAFRLSFVLPMAVAMGLVALADRPAQGEAAPVLRLGDWSIESRSTSMGEQPMSWTRFLFGGYLGVVALLAVLLQLSVGFEPLTGGGIARLWWAVLVAAAVNAIAEETVYRGFLQPAFIRLGGVGPGLWVTGLLFGLVHWGSSVGLLAALPTSLAIGLGSVVWGKAAFETRGLSWPVAAHFLIDVAVMAAYFV